jgi:signal transduction histidine kinase
MKASLSAQLLLSHLCVGLIPLLFISWLLWTSASKGLDNVSGQGVHAVEQAAYNELQLMCQIKEKQISYFFKVMVGQMHMLRDNPWFVRHVHNLDQAFTEVGRSADAENGSVHSEIWQHLARQADEVFQDVCTDFDWNNLYLINSDGRIIYSLRKSSDLGQSLVKAPLISTSLGKAFAQLRSNPERGAAFGDYAPYTPLDNEPSAFLITHIKQEKDDRGAAYLAVQPSTTALRDMIKMGAARKQTLEAYVVGNDGYMRSDSVLDPENYSRDASFRLGNKVLTQASREAAAGKSGTGIITDYRGVKVLSSWMPVEILGIRWALICEINEQEALAARNTMRQSGEEADQHLLQWIVTALLLTLVIVAAIAWFVARSISRPIVHAAEVAGIIASGDMQQRLNMKREDEIGRMAAALDAMVDKVAKNFRQVNGAAELAERMRGELDLRTLAKNVVSFLAGFLGAQMGSLYLADKSGGKLSIAGSYAFNKRKGIDTAIQLGEGIAGQAAAERILLSVTDLPEDYVRISSTLGNAVPRNVLALPFLHENRLVGVLELASFKEFSDEDMKFLNQISESIAVVFAAARSRQEVQTLLEETQSQSEELRASNEELEAQTAALKEFQEELKSQQAELEIVNANLKEKSTDLLTQKNEIEQRNKELTAAREEVEERSKDLAMASKYKSEFLANMSHELRTPLNSLLLLAKSLADNREGTLSGHQQESAKVIAESGKDLLNLINEILDLSKIEAGRIELDLEEVPLADLTANASTMFRHMAESKGLEFTVSLAPSLPPSIVTDRKRVEQILKNFLGNSIKFTAKGKVSLSIAWPAPQTKFRR